MKKTPNTQERQNPSTQATSTGEREKRIASTNTSANERIIQSLLDNNVQIEKSEAIIKAHANANEKEINANSKAYAQQKASDTESELLLKEADNKKYIIIGVSSVTCLIAIFAFILILINPKFTFEILAFLGPIVTSCLSGLFAFSWGEKVGSRKLK